MPKQVENPRKLLVETNQQPSSIVSKSAPNKRFLGFDRSESRPDVHSTLKACFCAKEKNECCHHLQFPLPCPPPCCKPEPKRCCGNCNCSAPAPPPFVIHQCPAPPKQTAKVDKLCFVDPCNKALCKWCISQDGTGSKSLLIQADGEDKALLDCDGNLNLLGAVETTSLCFAPIEEQPEQQWKVVQNPETGFLHILCGEIGEEPDFESQTDIVLTKCGVLVQSVAEVNVSGEDECYLMEKLAGTVLVLNESEEQDKKLELLDGEANGQCVTIVNVNAVELIIEHESLSKTVAGESSQKLIWSSTAQKWTCV